ncbi:MAG: DUF5723 family protein [Mongoliitalea sp.]
MKTLIQKKHTAIKLFAAIACTFLGLTPVLAQQGFVGIQNTSRRGLLHATMNPAEITNLHKKVEVNLFAISANASNDVLSFSDFLGEEEISDILFNRTDGPVNVRTDVGVMGPSVGFKMGKWGFGLTTQGFFRTDIVDLDANLGRSITTATDGQSFVESTLNLPYNQRINVAGWTEFGLMAGREIFENEKNRVSIGTGIRLLMPTAYFNAGIDGIRGTLRVDQNSAFLTNATGNLNLNYSGIIFDDSLDDFSINSLSFGSISGVGLDIGITHDWKKEGTIKATSGISFKGLGSLDFGSSQVNHNYSINIPSGQSFDLNQLDGGSFEEIEDQLLASGFFSKTSDGNYQPQLPRLFSAYTDLRLTKAFYLSLFSQFNLGNSNANQQITAQNIFALTPRIKFGAFEIFSPWMSTEVAGLSGGLGFRAGGFFIGSNSVLTGFLTDSQQADAYVGWSFGFGK